MARRHVLLLRSLVPVLATLWLWGAGVSPATGDGPARGSLGPGDLITRVGITVKVPPRGEGVWATKELIGGGGATLGVETGTDGSVRVHLLDAGHPGGAAVTASSQSDGEPRPPCRDGSYNRSGTHWRSTYLWYFKTRSRPDGMSRTNAVDALRSGAANITRARNNCGLTDGVGARQSYGGRTRAAADIGKNARCLAPDGRNVVSFGNLPSSYVAYTCWWTSGSATVQADVKLNKADHAWTARVRDSCTRRFSVEAVATHEFGHVFGLKHVSESSDGRLTMSSVIRPCQNSETTLGLGDIKGLEASY